MDASSRPKIRLYQDEPSDLSRWDPHQLAAQELLRPVPSRPSTRDLEPFSRSWFEALELKRYAPNGVWLQRILEFTRHHGETLLMIGPGLGSDALQYHRHGVDVTLLLSSHDPVPLIRRNFEFRNLKCRMVHGELTDLLPFEDGAFDLVYLNLIYRPEGDRPALTAELYRILKPGGKVFVLTPAYYDIQFWQRLLAPYRRWFHKSDPLSEANRYTGRGLKRLFQQFTEPRLSKRHLRTSDLPYLWRFLPSSLLERFLGRVLCLRAFKPLSAAFEGLPMSPEAIAARLSHTA